MKEQRIIKLLIVLLVFFIVPGGFKVYAQSEKINFVNQEVLDSEQQQEISELYDYITKVKNEYELIGNMNPKKYVDNFMKNGSSGINAKEFVRYILIVAFKEILSCFKLIGTLIVVCLVCAMLKNLQSAFSNDNVSNIAYFACYSLIIIIIAKSFYIGVDVARDAILGLTNFMAALAPILIMLLTTIGGFSQAATMDPIIMAVTNISARIVVDFIMPLVIMSFVLKFVNNISKDYKISRLSKLLNQVAVWTQGLMLTVFVGIISIRGIASQAIDQVTMKTAKFAVDNFIPVIGKSLSDAISTIAGYSLLLKSAIGSLGLVVVIVIVLIPIIKLIIMAAMFKISAALIEPVSDERIVDCVESAGTSLILLLAGVICVTIMCFIMIAIIAGTGKAVLMG